MTIKNKELPQPYKDNVEKAVLNINEIAEYLLMVTEEFCGEYFECYGDKVHIIIDNKKNSRRKEVPK